MKCCAVLVQVLLSSFRICIQVMSLLSLLPASLALFVNTFESLHSVQPGLVLIADWSGQCPVCPVLLQNESVLLSKGDFNVVSTQANYLVQAKIDLAKDLWYQSHPGD